MPNIKSAIKRVKVTEAKTLKNTIRKSALRTTLKKSKESIVQNGADAADSFKVAQKALDKAAAKNLIHKKTAARKKSKLAKTLKAAGG